MTSPSSPTIDYTTSTDYFRAMPLFEWTFAFAVANLSLQTYRLVAQLVSFVFDLFKLAYSRELFGPLTNDELRPYTQLFASKNDLVFKLLESIILTVAAFVGAKSLLNFWAIGVGVYIAIFLSHVLVLTLGAIFLLEQLNGFLSFETLLWCFTIFIETTSVILTVIVLGLMLGL